MVGRRHGFWEDHVISAHIRRFRIAKRFPGFDHALPSQIAPGCLQDLCKNISGAIADQVVDIGTTLRQSPDLVDQQLSVIHNGWGVILSRKVRRVEISPHTLCVLRTYYRNNGIVYSGTIEDKHHVGEPLFRCLLDGKTSFREAAEDQDHLHAPARERDELRGKIARRSVELLNCHFKSTALFQARLNFCQMRLVESISARQDTDPSCVCDCLEANVNHGLSGDARRRNRAVENITRKWLADDRGSAYGVVSWDLSASNIIRGGGRSRAAGGNH